MQIQPNLTLARFGKLECGTSLVCYLFWLNFFYMSCSNVCHDFVLFQLFMRLQLHGGNGHHFVQTVMKSHVMTENHHHTNTSRHAR